MSDPGADVFRALADATRRAILDELVERDGQTLFELCARLIMRHGLGSTRQAISQHLEVLEAAGLVRTRRQGRYKFHHLDTRPLRAVVERWPMAKEADDAHPVDERPGGRPGEGPAVLHGRPRIREEDRDPPR